MASPIILCDCAGMANDRWLECRAHGPKGDIPYTVGGSDVAAIFGLSPWTTPLELWLIKKGKMKAPVKSNQEQMEMGHLLEPIAAHWFEKKTGNLVTDDTNLYQHADHPYALANIDRRYTRQEDAPTTKRRIGRTTPFPSTMNCSCGFTWPCWMWSTAPFPVSGATTRKQIWPCRKSSGIKRKRT